MKNKQFTTDDQKVLEDIMLYRRDVRGNNFTHAKISDAVIQKILFSASLAPSVGFSQPWEFVVIREPVIKNKILESFLIEKNKAADAFNGEKRKTYDTLKLEGILEAPVNIAVFYRPSDEPILGQNTMTETGEYSVVCAIQNMWLMSRAMNIGLGWVSILNPTVVKEILKVPPQHKLVAYLCLGYISESSALPELERLNWTTRKEFTSAIHSDVYSEKQ